MKVAIKQIDIFCIIFKKSFQTCRARFYECTISNAK